MASNATEPAVTADFGLEAAASALRADLAARGVPADELPEPVMLALAAQQERINQLHAICRALHGRLERVENAAAPLLVRSRDDTTPEEIRQIQEAMRSMQARPLVAPAEDYRRRSDRLRAQAEHARSLREGLTPLGTPLSTMYPPEAPRFRHDCPDCEFLGRSENGQADLYYCPDHLDFRDLLIARDMDCPGNYLALWAVGEPPRDPYLAEAYRRAVARGLVGGVGEGG
jgi:hypothetical protein